MFRYAKEVSNCLLEIQQGNLTSFKQLYDLTAEHLFGVARMYLANKDLADDVVSVMYMKALKYIKSFNPQQNGYNWLCKITQNVASTFNKRELTISELEKQFAQEQGMEYIELGFGDIDFFMLLDELDEPDKKIAYLRFYEGKTMQEIGRRLNISAPAVYQRIRKICNILKKNQKISK